MCVPYSHSGPPFYLAAPGVDRHHYLSLGAGLLSGRHHTPVPPFHRMARGAAFGYSPLGAGASHREGFPQSSPRSS
jgi:hypothetical protein